MSDIDWDKVDDLGKVYDAALAKRLGVPVKEVFKARKAKGILPFGKNRKPPRKVVDWDAQPLGVETDISLAQKLGVSSSTVAYHRSKRERDALETEVSAGGRRGINWDKQPLGVESDRVIADRLGIDYRAVGYARRLRGIESAKWGRFAAIDWDKEPLGKESDRSIAKRLGVCKSQVSQVRRDRGIEGLRVGRPSGVDWATVDGLGTTPASILSKRLGVDYSTVVYHRKRLGITPPPVDKVDRYRRSAKSIRDHYTSKNESKAARIVNQLTDEMGTTLTRVCEVMGLHTALVSAFRTGREEVMGPSGFRGAARKFASFYGMAPDQIWTQYDPLLRVAVRNEDLDRLPSTGTSPFEAYDGRQHLRLLSEYVFSALTERERDIITSRFGHDAPTLEEIGVRYDVSRERIRQLEWRALQKLRRAFGILSAAEGEEPLRASPHRATPNRSGCLQHVLDALDAAPNQAWNARALAEHMADDHGYSTHDIGCYFHPLFKSGRIRRAFRGHYQSLLGIPVDGPKLKTPRAKKLKAKPEPKPKPKPKKTPKERRRALPGVQDLLDFLDASPDTAYHRSHIIEHLQSLGYKPGASSNYLTRSYHDGLIRRISLGHYQSLKPTPKGGPRKAGSWSIKKDGVPGHQRIVNLLDESPDEVFSVLQIREHMATLEYADSTVRLYITKLNKAQRIRHVGRGLYQSILSAPKKKKTPC